MDVSFQMCCKITQHACMSRCEWAKSELPMFKNFFLILRYNFPVSFGDFGSNIWGSLQAGHQREIVEVMHEREDLVRGYQKEGMFN